MSPIKTAHLERVIGLDLTRARLHRDRGIGTGRTTGSAGTEKFMAAQEKSQNQKENNGFNAFFCRRIMFTGANTEIKDSCCNGGPG